MSRYILKHFGGDLYHIRLGGRQIGSVTTRVGNKQLWFGKIGSLVAEGTTARAAFEAVVTKRNRVQLVERTTPSRHAKPSTGGTPRSSDATQSSGSSSDP